MQGKARYIFPAAMAFFMSFFMSGIITAVNLGLDAAFLLHWAKAWAFAFPLASVAAFFSAPVAGRITRFVVARLEGPGGTAPHP